MKIGSLVKVINDDNWIGILLKTDEKFSSVLWLDNLLVCNWENSKKLEITIL